MFSIGQKKEVLHPGIVEKKLIRGRYEIRVGGRIRVLTVSAETVLSPGDRVTVAVTGDGSTVVGQKRTKETEITEIVIDG